MKTLNRSFAGGEITPELYGRIDLTKYQTGLALARNFTVLPHGPASRRPGTRFIIEAHDSTRLVRLIPFAFNADQTVVLEFGHLYVRFHIDGETLLQANKAIVSIVGSTVTVTAHGWATGDDVFIGNRFHRITVTGANTFTTADRWGVATVATGTAAARVYTVATPWAQNDVFDLHYAQDSDVLTITHPGHAARELRRLGAANWQLSTISFAPSGTVPTGLTVTATVGTPGNQNPQAYVITAVGTDGVTESLPSAPVNTSNNLSVSGNFNTLTWTLDPAVVRYRLYKQRGGIFGYIGQSAVAIGETISSITAVGTTATLNTAAPHLRSTGDIVRVSGTTPAAYSGNFIITVTGASTFTYTMLSSPGGAATVVGTYVAARPVTDDNVLADTSTSPPEDVYTLNAAAGDYPTAVTHYEQRRWFAGTNNDPQTVWATRNATQSNLTSSTPSQDDDGLQFRIAAQQQNAIRHLLPLTDLIALTVGGEFRIFADNAPNITPTSLSIKPQGFSGASTVQPALTSGSILYVQSQGSRVRELAYNGQNNAYGSIDISIMAPHLFNGYSVIDLAYCRAPVPTLWAVRSDGVLLGMTYVPEQQVYAWHQHTTDGTFESVCVVSEGLEDVLYVVVKRTINGRQARYIERLQTRIFVDQPDAFFVDSGLTYDGAPVSSVTGLWHLEGKQVQILADGAVHPPRTVTGGSVTLDASYSTVHAGLAYSSDMQTLPLSVEMQAGGQYMQKNVNGVAIRVTQSNLVKAGPSFAKLTEYPARDHTDPYGSPPALRTGELRFAIGPSWSSGGPVCIRQDQPLPLTVLSLALDVAPGG